MRAAITNCNDPARQFAELRRLQLEAAMAGRIRESAQYAEQARQLRRDLCDCRRPALVAPN